MEEVKEEVTLQQKEVTEKEEKSKEEKDSIVKKVEEAIPMPKTKGKKIAFVSIAAIVAFCVIFTCIKMFPAKQPIAKIITAASLGKVLEVEELSTMEYVYNAVAKVTDKNDKGKEEELYYVAYEGVVSAGIEFTKIVVNVDENSKLITIKLPEVTINDPTINAGTLDYIYMKAKYKKDPTIPADAYNKSLEDLRNRVAKDEDSIKQLAYTNTVEAVKALTKPWISQVSSEYEVEVK